MKLSFTIGNSHLRSSPMEGPHDDNSIKILPGGHPVAVLGVVNNTWLSVSTVADNTLFRGFMGSSTLRSSGGWSFPEFSEKDMPRRAELLLDPETAPLLAHLSISPPDQESRGAEALTFQRSRKVEADWNYLLGSQLTENTDPDASPAFSQGDEIAYFVNHFLKIWGLTGQNSADRYLVDKGKIIRAIRACVPKIEYLPYAPIAGGLTFGSFRLSRRVASWYPSDDYYVVAHPIADRFFKLTPIDGTTFVADDFVDLATFENTLLTKVQRFEQCVPEAYTNEPRYATSERLITDAEQVDLGPALILRQNSELDALQAFTNELSLAADRIGIGSVSSLIDENQVNALVRAVLTMKGPKVDRDLRKNELREKAAALGYLIAESDANWTFEDGSTDSVKAGRLYRPYNEIVSWSTSHTRTGTRSNSGFFGIGASSSTYEWTEWVHHEKWVTKHVDVAVDLDPWTERERQLSAAGFTSYRFDRIGSGYFTAAGDTLEEVMQRCENDESFRQACAVWIPIYEQKISKGLMLTRYSIVKRPHLGIRPVHLPRLYIEELLSFRTQWKNAELGELVYTINLAPGEERSVTVEQRSSRSVDETRSTVSVLDLTELTSNDLNSEIEKEARSTTEQTNSNNWSATASGMVKGITGSLGGSGGSTMSTSQFARTFEKIARKAASSIARNTKQEVRSSTTIKSETSRTESTTIKIKNMNDGRTLNLLFYRMYNVLNTKLCADEITLTSESGVELIAGSGITIPRQLPLSELPRALHVFDFGYLPFSTNFPRSDPKYAAALWSYWSHIVTQFIGLLKDEYFRSVDEEVSNRGVVPPLPFNQDLVDLLDRLSPENFDSTTSTEKVEAAINDVLTKIARLLEDVIEASNLGSHVLKDGQIRVASPGLYVDSLIGMRPATEPYAEEMRAQAVSLRAAEAAKERGLAGYYNSLAAKNEAGGSKSLVITATYHEQYLIFNLPESIPAGPWSLTVDGKPTVNLLLSTGQRVAQVQFNAAPEWFSNAAQHTLLLCQDQGDGVLFVVALPAIN